MNRSVLTLLVAACALAALPAAGALPNPCYGQVDVGSCERWVRQQADYDPRPIEEFVENTRNDLRETVFATYALSWYAYCVVLEGEDVPPAYDCPP